MWTWTCVGHPYGKLRGIPSAPMRVGIALIPAAYMSCHVILSERPNQIAAVVRMAGKS
jgi:hypothetical protein